MTTVEQISWLAVTSSGFDLLTHQINLIFVFNPLSLVPDLSQSSTRKFLRCAVCLSAYSYTSFNISGMECVWADMLTRWSAPSTVRRLIKVPALPSTNAEEFLWPDLKQIANHQLKSYLQCPEGLQMVDVLWRNATGPIWIAENAEDI